MGAAMHELPLALFSTFAPMGAGAFVLLMCAFLTNKFSEERLAKIDKMTLIPLLVVVLGFICAFFHLASPLHAFGVFAGVGSSPLSNEILVGVIFVVVACVYWILARAGKLSQGARVACIAVVAVLGVVFAFFIGQAYGMETIQSWNTGFAPMQIVGFALVGGAALGILTLALAGAFEDVQGSGLKVAGIVVLVLGLALAIWGLVGQTNLVSGMENALASGAELVAAATPALVVSIVCLVAAVIAGVIALGSKKATVVAAIAVACAVIGVFAGRLVFYALVLSVGLYII